MTIYELYLEIKKAQVVQDFKRVKELEQQIGIRVQNILDTFPNRSFQSIDDELLYEFRVDVPKGYSEYAEAFHEMTVFLDHDEANDD